MATLARFLRNSAVLRVPFSASGLIQQFDQLHIALRPNSSWNAANAKFSAGFSCASPSSSLLNVSGGGEFPILEQKRYRKFFLEWTFNYKHKGSRKHVFKPYYKWDYEQMEGMEYTHTPFKLRALGGRSPETGRKINQRIGGGYKFDFFWIDLRRNRFSPTEGGCYEERILEVRRAPNETAFVALAAGTRGRRWILATENMKAGDVVRSYNYIPNQPLKDYEMPEGDSWPVGALPPGSIICNIQKVPSAEYALDNSKIDYVIVNAGGSATILRQQGEFTVISVSKRIEMAVKRECVAVLGRLSNTEHGKLGWGSMNMKRRWGIKQGSGVWHRKDGYCGRKAHPLRKIIVDEEKKEPPPIKIPITLGRKEFNALFGNQTSQPSLWVASPHDTPNRM